MSRQRDSTMDYSATPILTRSRRVVRTFSQWGIGGVCNCAFTKCRDKHRFTSKRGTCRVHNDWARYNHLPRRLEPSCCPTLRKKCALTPTLRRTATSPDQRTHVVVCCDQREARQIWFIKPKTLVRRWAPQHQHPRDDEQDRALDTSRWSRP
jgi:hypothetical protein